MKFRIIVFLSCLIFSACKQDKLVFPTDTGEQSQTEPTERPPVKPDDITFITDYDETVKVVLSEVDAEKAASVSIAFARNNEIDTVVVTSFSDTLNIDGLEINAENEITVWVNGFDGAKSKDATFNVVPKPFPKDLVAANIGIVGGKKEAEVFWQNVSEQSVNIVVTINDVKYSSGLTKELSSSIVIPLERGNYDVKMQVLDSLGNGSEIISENLEILDEVELDRTGWIATADNEYTPGENTGLASALIDGNLNTYWHTNWNSGAPSYPHWARFDMLETAAISKIAMARRQNNATGMTRFKLEGSLDGVQWVLILNNQIFNPNINDFQEFSFAPQEFRYLRMTATEGPHNYTHLAEIKVYALK